MDSPAATFDEILGSVDEQEVVMTCARSHAGGRYWDELAISIKPVLETDSSAPWRLLDDLRDRLPVEVTCLEEGDQLDTPEFFALVRDWADARLADVKAAFLALASGRAELAVTRIMHVSEDWLAELGEAEGATMPASRLGFFWSAGDGAPDTYFEAPEGCDVGIEVLAVVSAADVDMRNTLLARMDYMNGDEEGEIRLHPDALVTVTGILRHEPAQSEKGWMKEGQVPQLFRPA